MKKNKLKILFAGGGTGGHLYPAIALCEKFIMQLGQDNVEVLFIGSHYGIEKKIVPQSGYNFKALWIRGIQRGFSWHAIKINFWAPLRIFSSILQSVYYIKKFNPDIVIGTGGYASGPAVFIAGKMGKPVFLQEQNVYPGATTKMLEKFARTIYVSYQESEKFLKNIKTLGTPLRISLKKQDKSASLAKYGFNQTKKTIFFFGGSQGSKAINLFLKENLNSILSQTNTQWIWQTGKFDYLEINKQHGNNPNLFISDYIYDMDFAYSAADLIISRSGALTLAEINLFGKASILIPLPTAAANHQEKNARALEANQAAQVILQNKLDTQTITKTINKIFSDETLKKQMEDNSLNSARPFAAENIIKDILNQVNWNAK